LTARTIDTDGQSDSRIGLDLLQDARRAGSVRHAWKRQAFGLLGKPRVGAARSALRLTTGLPSCYPSGMLRGTPLRTAGAVLSEIEKSTWAAGVGR